MADKVDAHLGAHPKTSRNRDAPPARKAPKPGATAAMAEPALTAAPLPESSAADAVTKPAPVETVAIPPAPEPAPAFTDDDANEPMKQAREEPTSEGTINMASSFQDTAAAGTAAVTETADKAKAMFGDMNGRAKLAMEKSVKLGEEMTEFAKGNVEAVVQSGRVAAKGAEALAQEAAEAMKKHLESATATMKSFASVKSPTELFQLQSEAAKSYFDSAVADMSKYTEQLMKLAGDVSQPLSSRYSVAMEKMKTSAL